MYMQLKESVNNYSRTFYNEVRRCDEMEQLLRKFSSVDCSSTGI